MSCSVGRSMCRMPEPAVIHWVEPLAIRPPPPMESWCWNVPSIMYFTVSKPRWGCHGVPLGSPGAYSTSPIWSMWTNGSRSARLTPAKARRTGKPSPSRPRGAFVTDRTWRSATLSRSSAGTAGSVVRSATVTAGPETSDRCRPTRADGLVHLSAEYGRLSGGASVEVALPVGRHPAGRARGGLAERMVLGRGQRRPVVVLLGRIVPEPVFARLEAPDDGMAVLLGVVAGVLARRAVAAADMATCRATAEVQPPPVRCEALDAPVTAGLDLRVDGYVGH